MFASALIALAVVPSAFAAVSITAPIATTSWQAGAPQTLTWMDDGKAPSLKDFGPSKVSIYVGNAIQQTQLQQITDNVDVSTTGSIIFTPDASIGPNSNIYFIRFESLSLKDPSSPQFPAEAFSAKFTLTGMSGTFNSTVQAQIDAASTAPVGSPTSAPAASAPSSPAASAPAASKPAASAASGSHSSSAGASPTGATKATNGASGVFASVGLVGSVVAVLGAMMF